MKTNILSSSIVIFFSLYIGVAVAATTPNQVNNSAPKIPLESQISSLELKLMQQDIKMQSFFEEQKRNHQHYLSDIDKYKNESNRFVGEKINSKWNEALVQAVFASLGVLITSGFVIWLSLKRIFKGYIEKNTKRILDEFSSEMAHDQIALMASISGVSLLHWWKYYLKNDDDGDLFQRSITTISELTVKAVQQVPTDHPNFEYVSQFLSNTLYYLADTEDERFINDRKHIVKGFYKDVEKAVTGENETNRDDKWAEEMDCLCFALYRFKLRNDKTIVKYLKEAMQYFDDERNEEVRQTYQSLKIV